ncbi:MAG: S53 family peptidase [bacterium]
MPQPLLIALLLLLSPLAATADSERTAVEQHLMRLERSAVTLGPSTDTAPVRVVLGFGWRDRAGLDLLVIALHDPHSPLYQQYLTPQQFTRRFAPRASQLAAAARYLRRAGLRVVSIAPSRLQLTAEGRVGRVAHALNTSLIDMRDSAGSHVVPATAPVLPDELGAQVVSVGKANALRPPGAAATRQTIAEAPFDPAEIGRLYGFDAVHAAGVRGESARHSTIAIATAFAYDPADLEVFWNAHNVARTRNSVELVSVAGTTDVSTSADDRLETTLDVEWASSMAPAAGVLVYAGTDALSTTFLRVYDRIVSDNRAAVLTTSWGRCESDYPQAYLNQIDAVFTRAAAQGITVVAAAGDRGAVECGGTAPSVAFPAAHPYVLAVGGTGLVRDGDGFTESAWSGSGGGTSTRFAAPPWQMQANSGRVLADVAFNADPASGFRLFSGGTWYVAGGTSVSAPIWAALVALTNQARAAAGRPTLGLAAPQLCELAAATGLSPAPFADITDGGNGAFSAAPGWDFPTGWGSPRAAQFVDALAHWTPTSDGRGGVNSMVALVPVGDSVEGAVRLRFQRRCMTTDLGVHARGLKPGSYTLILDDSPAVSFATDARGGAMLSVPQADLRGRRVQLLDADGVVRFALTDEAPGGGVVEAVASLKNTGVASGASGSLLYRSGSGREQLTVRTDQLPAGVYDVRVGSDTIGTLKVATSGRQAEATFDSFGFSGVLLPMSPVCKPILLVRGGSAYLRSIADALTPGLCVGGAPRT